MHQLASSTAAVLRAIQDLGPITMRELDELPELVRRLSATGAKSATQSLYTRKLIDAEKLHSRGTLYTISTKGRRTLSALDGLAPGVQVAAPRDSIGDGTYTGEPPFIGRPGAMRAFELPSIENGARVPRTRPVLMGAAKEVRK